MDKIISYYCLATFFSLLLFTGNVYGGDNKQDDIPKEAICVIDYRMEDGTGKQLKDSSAFHNDAVAVGEIYGDMFEYHSRGGGDKSLKVINPTGRATSANVAFISHSRSLQVQEFIFELDIKPVPDKNAPSYSILLSSEVTPFFFKKAKTSSTRSHKPMALWIFRDNKVQLNLSVIEKDGSIKTRYFKSTKPLPLNKFTRIRWMLENHQLYLYFGDEKIRKWNISGKLLYDHPDYYPDRVSFTFGSGTFKGELDNLKIFDLAMKGKNKKAEIKISTGKDFNFFAPEEKKEFTIALGNFTDEEKIGVLSYTVVDHENKKIFNGEKSVSLKPLRSNQVTIEIPSKLRGCFWLNCELKDENGKLLAKREGNYAVGAIRDLASIPDSSPFGAHPLDVYSLGTRLPDMGTKWIRIMLNRQALEPEDGQYRWSISDASINYHKKSGANIMGCLWGMPTWAVCDDVLKKYKTSQLQLREVRSFPPKDWKKHEKFLRAMISRYKDKVDVWEVWNEANVGYWRGTVDEFMRLLKLTHKIVREIDPSAKIAGPSVCRAGWDSWSSKILKKGAAKYMDVWLAHYFGGGYMKTPNPESAAREIEDTRKMMATFGKVLPIWDGESGYATATRNGKDLRPYSPEELASRKKNKEGFLNNNWVADGNASNNTKCNNEILSSNSYVRRMAVCLANGLNKTFNHPMGSWNYEADFWVGRHWKGTGILLPAIAWTALVERISNADFIRRIDLGDEKLHGYLFKKRDNGETIAILWCSKGYEDVNLLNESNPDRGAGDALLNIITLGLSNKNPSNVAVFNLWGNPVEKMASTTKNIRLRLTESPVYLEGIGDKIKKGENFLSIDLPNLIVRGEKTKLTVRCVNPLKEKVSGEIVLKAPAGFSFSPENFTLNMAPGEKITKDMILETPVGYKKNTAMFNVSFIPKNKKFTETRTAVAQMILPPFPCVKKKIKMNIDGKYGVDEWSGVKPILLEKEEQVVLGRPLCYADPATINRENEWYGPDDLSAKAWLFVDHKNLYMLVKVKDDSIMINDRIKQVHLSDGLEVFIDCRPESDQGIREHSEGVCQLFFIPGDKSHSEASWIWAGKSAGQMKAWKVEVKSETTKDGYILEAKIPFRKWIFPKLNLKDGRVIGFDLCVNDSDYKGKRKSQISWRGTKNNYFDASKFGKLVILNDKKKKNQK